MIWSRRGGFDIVAEEDCLNKQHQALVGKWQTHDSAEESSRATGAFSFPRSGAVSVMKGRCARKQGHIETCHHTEQGTALVIL